MLKRRNKKDVRTRFFFVGVGILYNNAELSAFLGPCCEVCKGCCHMAKDFGIGCQEKRADLGKE